MKPALELLRKIPKGKVTTYKSLAEACNSRGYRAIGQIMKNNPRPDLYPCYRVVRSDVRIGGYSGNDPKNIAKKTELLRNDGIEIVNNKIDLKKHLFRV